MTLGTPIIDDLGFILRINSWTRDQKMTGIHDKTRVSQSDTTVMDADMGSE